MKLFFQCPHCGVQLETADEIPSGNVECLGCGGRFRVEAPAVPVVRAHAAPPEPSPHDHKSHPHHHAPHHHHHLTAQEERRQRQREEARARWLIIRLFGAGTVLIGGLVGLGFWLTHKRSTPTTTPGPSAAAELSAAARDFLGAHEKQSAAQQAAREKLAQEAIDQEKKAVATREASIRERQRQVVSRELFGGDDAAADEFLEEVRGVEQELFDLFGDGIPGNEPRDIPAWANDRLMRRIAANSRIMTALKNRSTDELARVLRGFGGGTGTAPQPDFITKGGYISSGTGFWISPDGWLLTNAHVVGDSRRIDVRISENGVAAAVVKATDRTNDLALLKVDTTAAAWLPLINREAPMGDTVFTIGYPNTFVQGLEPKFTDGRISSLSGMRDDKNHYQTTVPVQPGNSGGPLVHLKSGWVVGVMSARLTGGPVPSAAPENVSYGVKSTVVWKFIESVPEAKPTLTLATPAVKAGGERAVIERVKSASVLVLRK